MFRTRDYAYERVAREWASKWIEWVTKIAYFFKLKPSPDDMTFWLVHNILAHVAEFRNEGFSPFYIVGFSNLT